MSEQRDDFLAGVHRQGPGPRAGSNQGARRHVEVAIALVFDRDHERLLICRRQEDAVLGGYWEFPGGKCEPDEAPADCVCREVREETGLTVRVLRRLQVIEHEYAHARVRLHAFLCAWISGEAEALEVAETRWIDPAEVGSYRFPEANKPVIHEAARGFAALAQP